jgi:hypothetical protein
VFRHDEIYPHRSLMRLGFHAYLLAVKRAYIKKRTPFVCHLYSIALKKGPFLLLNLNRIGLQYLFSATRFQRATFSKIPLICASTPLFVTKPRTS